MKCIAICWNTRGVGRYMPVVPPVGGVRPIFDSYCGRQIFPDLLLNLYDHTAHTRQGRLLRQRTDECHSRLQKQILPITGWQLFVKLRWLFPCWLMLLFDLSADKYMVAATGWQITLCLNSFPGPQRNGADPLLPEKKKPMRLRKERGAFSFPGSNNTPRKKKQQLWYVLYSLLAIPCKGRSRGCAF